MFAELSGGGMPDIIDYYYLMSHYFNKIKLIQQNACCLHFFFFSINGGQFVLSAAVWNGLQSQGHFGIRVYSDKFYSMKHAIFLQIAKMQSELGLLISESLKVLGW